MSPVKRAGLWFGTALACLAMILPGWVLPGPPSALRQVSPPPATDPIAAYIVSRRKDLGDGDCAARLARLIREAAVCYRLDPWLLAAQTETESDFDVYARGVLGERGPLQIGAAAFREASGSGWDDWEEQFRASVRYLARLRDLRQGDMELALAAYNAGSSLRPEAARKRAGAYLRRVDRIYRGLPRLSNVSTAKGVMAMDRRRTEGGETGRRPDGEL